MTFTIEEEKKVNYAALSFLSALLLLLGLGFTLYMILKFSGHPLITGAMGQTIEEREIAGQLVMETVQKSLYYNIPIYLISFGLWIMAIVKKQKSKLMGILILLHLFIFLPLFYLVILK